MIVDNSFNFISLKDLKNGSLLRLNNELTCTTNNKDYIDINTQKHYDQLRIDDDRVLVSLPKNSIVLLLNVVKQETDLRVTIALYVMHKIKRYLIPIKFINKNIWLMPKDLVDNMYLTGLIQVVSE